MIVRNKIICVYKLIIHNNKITQNIKQNFKGKNMKKRSEVEEKYKWDIGCFKTREEIENAFSTYEKLIENTKQYYGKFTDKDKFFEYLTAHKKEEMLINSFVHFLGNTYNIDSSDVEIIKLIQRFEILAQKSAQASSFVEPQLSHLSNKYLNELLADKRIKGYENVVKDIIRNKPHSLDEKSNALIANLSNSFNNSSSVFDIISDSEMKFDSALDSKGKAHKLDQATYAILLRDKDRTLRKNAFKNFLSGYGQFNKTFAELFVSNMKAENDDLKLHKFPNLLNQQLFGEQVPEIVFENNIKNVNKNLNLNHKYVRALGKDLGLKDIAYYDLFLDEKINGKVTIDIAHQTILKALEPLGKEYVAMVKHKLSDKSIDYMPSQNKSTGGYCSNCYGAKTLILMNWQDDFNSMSTLIHEMGHCINAEYFNKTQSITDAEISIFAAEIASTVNEILLNQYMQKTATKRQKKYYLNQFLNSVRSTIFRQTLFSEFELFAHTSIEKETPITYKELNEKYFELNKKYYSTACKLPDELKYEWSRIPHFYRPYYVYSYSTGMLTGITIADKLLHEKDFASKYIEFLKNGTHRPAVEVLKEIDIDLTTDKPFEQAFKFIKSQLDEYILLV